MKPKLLICGLAALLTTVAFGQPEDREVRRSIENFYAKMDREMSKGDFRAMLSHRDPGYVYTDVQGHRMDYGQMKSMMMNMRGSMRDMRCKTTVRNVTGTMQEAFAWVEVVMSCKQKMGNRWTAMKQTHRFTETHRGTPRGWMTMMTQELPKDEPWSFKTGGGF
ncbi:MAG: hypothetical protein ABL949_11650 [Fimbriimonadaceae bacterium]